MKKSTLILLLVAVAAGAAVYFLEYKPGKPRDEEKDETRPAFTFTREDIAGITVTRAGEKIEFAAEKEKWAIRQPVVTPADESAINALIGDLTSARIEREFSASDPDTYGLRQPPVRIEVKLKDGKTHRIELGSKDVIGSSAYARIDGGSNIALLPASLLTSVDKSLDEFRDKSLLGITQYDLSGARFKSPTGSFELTKKDDVWLINGQSPAEETEVSSVLGEITVAKAAEIVSETADDAAKYGLDKPQIEFTARLSAGGEKTLGIGKKADSGYYAKASDRPQIYRVEQALYDKLTTKMSSLRSKNIVRINRDELSRVQIRNPNVTLTAENKGEGKWVVVEPAEKKDKEAFAFKLLDPLETKATEILDSASPAVNSKLAKPPVEVRLTGKDGKTTVIRVSAADGENVWVRVEGKSEVYKAPKSLLDSLSFKLDEAVSSAP